MINRVWGLKSYWICGCDKSVLSLLMVFNCCPRRCPGCPPCWSRPHFLASRPSAWTVRPGPSWAGCSGPGTARACVQGSSAPSTLDSPDLPCARSSAPARGGPSDETFITKDALWQWGLDLTFSLLVNKAADEAGWKMLSNALCSKLCHKPSEWEQPSPFTQTQHNLW